jgi:PTS system galactosamine-specific IIB component
MSVKGPHILLTRIDNRLVHGQVGGTWINTLGANLLIVANDDVATNEMQQEIMKMTAANFGNEIRFFSIAKTIDVIWKAADRQKIFIVVKTPQDALRLVEGNVPITKIDIGNMHAGDGKRQITRYVYMNGDDIETLNSIKDKGIDVYIQELPTDNKTTFNE